jgi:hypothetical protein
MSRVASLVLTLGVLAMPSLAVADMVAIGVFSFDNIIPDGTSPGVNAFDVYNFTGSYDLSPDLPVATNVTFLDAAFTADIDGGGTAGATLGDIGPGPFTAPQDAQFSDTINFLDATFTATLDSLVFQVDDGNGNFSTFTASTSALSAQILASNPPDLAAGTDLAVIYAEGDFSSTPEPGTALLGLAPVAFLLASRRKSRP